MTQRRTRSDAFFSPTRLGKLADALIGRDKETYWVVRDELKQVYANEEYKTPFDVTWARAIAKLKEDYNYVIPDRKPTAYMREQMRGQRAAYERKKANDEEEAAERLREINAWKENF